MAAYSERAVSCNSAGGLTVSEAAAVKESKGSEPEQPAPGGTGQKEWPDKVALPAPPSVGSGDFSEVVRIVQDAAHAWGIRDDLSEGKFVSAFLGAVEWIGRVSHAAQAEFRQIARQQADVAKVELARAEALTKATNATLTQARSALINLQVERENITARLIQETMPTVAQELRKTLVTRVNDETSALKLRRAALAAVGALAIFLGGFGVRAWDDREAIGALERCLAKPLQTQSAGQLHLYCDVTSFAEPSR
jgi:hypothetical protein